MLNNNPNLLNELKHEYESFYKDIEHLIATYIALNRNLMMPPNQEALKRTNEDIKKLVNENYRLKKYLSHANFKQKIDKMIMSKKDNAYCSRRLILEELGDGLKKIRTINHLTMKQLAVMTNVSVSFISKIENYYITELPSYMFIDRIMGIFDCDIEYIFALIDSPKCSGDMFYKPIKMITAGNYPDFFAAFPQYIDITEMLKTIYCSNNVKAIDSVRSFLSELTENMKDN